MRLECYDKILLGHIRRSPMGGVMPIWKKDNTNNDNDNFGENNS